MSAVLASDEAAPAAGARHVGDAGAVEAALRPGLNGVAIPCAGVAQLGELTPTGRPGGQGRVYRPQFPPAELERAPVVVKLYRHPPPPAAVEVLRAMIAWSHSLPEPERGRLHGLTAWPLAIVTGAQGAPAGIVMPDLTPRFAVPFTMPSGRRQDVLLSLEHLLGDDGYLFARGLDVALSTTLRLRVAERVSRALAFLHAHAIVVSDIAPNNLLVSFGRVGPPVSFIDCDSMVFGGRQALPAVQTTDWQLPSEFSEPTGTRAADAYKLGLIVLRLLARSHDARAIAPHRRHVPDELRELLTRALSREALLRPAAAEWQQALERASARPAVDALYPGPLSRRVARSGVVVAPAVPAGALGATGASRGSSGPARAPGRSLGPRPAPRRRSRGGLSALALVWVAIGAIMLTLLLARLFAAAIPTSDTSQFQGAGGPTSGFTIVPGGGDRGGGGGQFGP
jgi:hypothetical protein